MIIPTAKDNQEDRLMKRWSVLKTVCITILSLFLLLFLYVFISIANYIHQVKVNETNYYTAEARMPQYAEVSDRYGMADGGFYSFETKKYKSLDKLGEALPAGCAQAAKDSVKKGSGLYTTDIKDTPVMRYEVPAEDLPLVESNSKSNCECHYYVLEYADNTYRFAIMVEMQSTR